MKKSVILLSFFVVAACSNLTLTQAIKPSELQSKLGVGMSTADVIAVLGIPEKKEKDQFTYPGVILSFKDGQLASAKIPEKTEFSELPLKPMQSDYKPDSIVLNKDKNSDLEAPAYKVAGYLHDESLFEKAVQAGVKVDGFTVKTNALCVALTEGFLKGTDDVVKVGYNADLRLRTDKGTYVFPESCLDFQKDHALAEQLKTQLASSKQAVAVAEAAVSGTTETKKDKSLIDWEAVKEFLKPQVPTQPK